MFEKLDQLNGLDSVFLFMESTKTPMHVGGLAVYDPSTRAEKTLSYSEIISFVSQRLHLAKPFRKKISHVPLETDYPYWVDDPDFDIKNHMRRYTLPEPGNWEQLCELAADMFAKPLDLTGPVWQFIYIDGINDVEGIPKGSFAILSKAHHCAIDGASGVDIASATHSISPEVETPSTVPAYRPKPPPSLLRKLARSNLNMSLQPLKTAISIQKLTPGSLKIAGEIVRRKQRVPSMLPPMTRFNKDVSSTRSFGSVSIPMDDIQLIRSHVEDVTINDVVLAIVGGAMRQYLEPLGELTKKTLVAMTPIAVKSKKRNAKKTGNSVANMTVELATDVSDPIERLIQIKTNAQTAKAQTMKLGPSRLSAATKVMPPLMSSLSFRTYTQTGGNRFMRPNANTVVTNVPGPNIPLYFCGSKLVAQFNMAPLHHGMGLVHTIFSYCGTLTVSFNACGKMLQNPRDYEKAIAHSFSDLKAASLTHAQEKTVKPTSKKSEKTTTTKRMAAVKKSKKK